MASIAKINAAYDAVLPLIQAEEQLAPFLVRGEIEAAVASRDGILFIDKLLGVAIDAADKVKS
jgi:hypothetical protein